MVEIAHLSMNMLRNDPYGRLTVRMSQPTHERKFTVPSHNLSESYKEKYDVVKNNNFKNSSHLHGNRLSTNSKHEIVAGSSVPSKHDLRGEVDENRETTVSSDGRVHSGSEPVTNKTVSDGRRDSVGQGLGSPRSVDSERARMLNRPQSDRSLIRSNSEISEKQDARDSGRSSRRSSRPSSAVDKTASSWTETKRPMSAQSQRGSDHIIVKRPSQDSSVTEGRQDSERPGTPVSVSGLGQSKGDSPMSDKGLVTPSSVKSRSSASNSVSGKRSEGDRPAVRSDRGIIGDRPSSGRSSRDRPVSGKSHSSTVSAKNNNNNNRGNVRPESARTYFTDEVETPERTPRKGSITVIERAVELGQEETLHAAACDDNSSNNEESGKVVQETDRNDNTDANDYEGYEFLEKPEEKEIVDGTTLTNGWELESESITGWEKEMGEDRKAGEHNVNTSKNDTIDRKGECEASSDNDETVEGRMVEGKEDKLPDLEGLEVEKGEHSQEHLDVGKEIDSGMQQNAHITKETPSSGQNNSLVNNGNHDQCLIDTETQEANVSETCNANKPDVEGRENIEVSDNESENYESENPGAIDLGDLTGPEEHEAIKSNSSRSGSRRLSGRSSHKRGSEKPPGGSRPISARSKPESVRSVRRRERTSLPDSVRSITRPMSAGSSKSRPVSARSVKSYTSGIEFIDNLSRRSSVHISSEFKSNALKNQAYEIEKDELTVRMEEHVGESIEGRQSSRVRANNSRKVAPNILNNGSIPDLRQKAEKNSKMRRNAIKNKGRVETSSQSAKPLTTRNK